MIAARQRRVARWVWQWWALATAAAATAASATPVQLVIESIDVDGRRLLAFGVRGLERETLAGLARADRSRDQWLELFSVRVETERAAPILGDYRADETGLWLVPSFPPERGVRYVAMFNPAVLDDRVVAGSAEPLRAYLAVEIDVDSDGDNPAPPATRVSAVHPSAGEVPENLLRLYVHFTAPMSRGNALRWVRLEHQSGERIEDAFLPLDEELWDRGATRLTLLLDPGRIKSGLVPHAQLGRALEQAHDVTLAIDAGWSDASGRPLAAGFRRSFRVGPADQVPPDPSRWRVDAPRAGGRQPLHVSLGETLDHALLHRLVWVEDGAGRKVSGSVALGDDERSWSFTPAAPWSAGAYSLRVDRRLEDLAGNRVGRAFEVDLERTPAVETALDAPGDDTPVGVPFTVGP